MIIKNINEGRRTPNLGLYYQKVQIVMSNGSLYDRKYNITHVKKIKKQK